MRPPWSSRARAPVCVHIERLVLDGLPVTPADVAQLRAGVEQRLARLLADVPAETWTGGATPRLAASPVHLAAQGSPGNWGRQLAQSVFASLAPQTNVSSTSTIQ